MMAAAVVKMKMEDGALSDQGEADGAEHKDFLN